MAKESSSATRKPAVRRLPEGNERPDPIARCASQAENGDHAPARDTSTKVPYPARSPMKNGRWSRTCSSMMDRASRRSILAASCSMPAAMPCVRNAHGACCPRTCRPGRTCTRTSDAGQPGISSRRCTTAYARCGANAKAAPRSRRPRHRPSSSNPRPSGPAKPSTPASRPRGRKRPDRPPAHSTHPRDPAKPASTRNM